MGSNIMSVTAGSKVKSTKNARKDKIQRRNSKSKDMVAGGGIRKIHQVAQRMFENIKTWKDKDEKSNLICGWLRKLHGMEAPNLLKIKYIKNWELSYIR